jgi:hypothetical protein
MFMSQASTPANDSYNGTVFEAKKEIPVKEIPMRKTLLVLFLLLCAVCLLAQDNTGKSSGTAGTTIQGCLSQEGAYYYLTDSSGKKIHLVGYNSKEIAGHVGHTVAIIGMWTIKTTDTTVQGSESTAKESQVFKVKSVKQISDSCKSM